MKNLTAAQAKTLANLKLATAAGTTVYLDCSGQKGLIYRSLQFLANNRPDLVEIYDTGSEFDFKKRGIRAK